MGDQPIWEQIGSSFVQHYYQLFDTDRSQLGAIYIDASCLTWEGQQFQGKAAIVEKLSLLAPFQGCQRSESTCHSLGKWPLRHAGKRRIVSLAVSSSPSLPFSKIAHSITAQDHQPTPDSCILSMVVGQLKADEDPVMGFHQVFLLKNINDAWVCTNDMFRLALHNFG
ncbi:nuclear transport factor 2 isoform X1 [Anguilla rostrata]|uniref:nuclear transport factor 2 isoform X1 n=1 Tax=Anguilla anguilla TaxID=7936 RepID=UPI0015AC4D68|nr:nuclear transport factor 2 isoform X1 [Anguilla anguilla]XP_035273428.1 nuclear transport factor 2 isoform X1 [Anguilla anguilla]XP_035273429.1 nuclear transport factor 2 isoform X1 [Anguilla anguilla]XP_035273430.1 nuclear transport factor 2 isoform X1 [Anguilla anguilla]